jgi:hypothetical protein
MCKGVITNLSLKMEALDSIYLGMPIATRRSYLKSLVTSMPEIVEVAFRVAFEPPVVARLQGLLQHSGLVNKEIQDAAVKYLLQNCPVTGENDAALLLDYFKNLVCSMLDCAPRDMSFPMAQRFIAYIKGCEIGDPNELISVDEMKRLVLGYEDVFFPPFDPAEDFADFFEDLEVTEV